jgi:hypothetical protein
MRAPQCSFMALAVVALALTACPDSPARAEPLTFGGNIEGSFSDPLDGIFSEDGTGTITLGSGTPSTLTFSGGEFTTEAGVPFLVGTVTLANESLVDVPLEMMFGLHFDFDEPAHTVPANFEFGAYLGQDYDGYVTLDVGSAGWNTFTAPDGEIYRFRHYGITEGAPFESDLPASLNAEPGAEVSGFLWGEIVHQLDDPEIVVVMEDCEDPLPATPEPGALVLAVIGLGAGWSVRCVRKRRFAA